MGFDELWKRCEYTVARVAVVGGPMTQVGASRSGRDAVATVRSGGR